MFSCNLARTNGGWRSWPKRLKEELKKDNFLLLQLGVAKELGYTLQELNQKITQEELVMWSVYFDLLNDEQEKNNRRAKYR